MKKTAKMAMLSIEDAEELNEDLVQALEMIKITDEIEEVEALGNFKEHLRKDDKEELFLRDELIESAPVKKDGYIIVPRIVG